MEVTNTAPLFDGSYETRPFSRMEADDVFVVTLDFSGTSGNSKFPGYPYGYFYVSFYASGTPASVSGRVYNNYASHGVGWHELDFIAEEGGKLYEAYNGYYGLQKLEITIVGSADNGYGYTSPCQIEFRLIRGTATSGVMLTKYGGETIYGNLTVDNLVGTVNGFTIGKSVPSDAKFTDTTYTAGTGLSLSNTTINHSNSVTAGTVGTSSDTSGVTTAIPYVTYDSQGHITSAGTHTHTIPAMTASDNGVGRITTGNGVSASYSSGNVIVTNTAGIYAVKGTQTFSTNAWTGNIDVDSLYDGLTIAYFLPYAGTGAATLNLTLKDGTTTGAIEVYYSGTTRLTTHYAKGSTMILTYWSAGSVSIDGTAIATSRWTCFDYNTSNTYQLYGYGINGQAGEYGVFAYTIVLEDSTGKWQSLTTETGTGTTKQKNPSGFRLGKVLYYYGTAKASGANVNSSGLYVSNAFDARNSFNCGQTLTAYSPVYLVGTVNDSTGLFYLDDTWYTHTLPSTADGKVYIYLGHAYDTYHIWLAPYHPIYEYVSGAIRIWTRDYPLMGRVGAVESDITSIYGSISSIQSDMSTMQPTINGKANISHTHTVSNITDLTNATSSKAGLMSSTDKTKLDGIDFTANYIVVDGTTIFVENDSQDLPDTEPVEEETNYGVFPVVGTHSSATNLWTGNLDVSSLYDGLTIAYYVPYGGNGSDITLNLSLNSGFNSGRVNVYYDGTTRARSQIKPGSTVILTYWSAGSISVEGVDTEDERWTRVDYCIDSLATSSANGLMSSTDKSKLDSINITYTSSNKLITFSF